MVVCTSFCVVSFGVYTLHSEFALESYYHVRMGIGR
jgi:hypothetical protein